MRDSTGTILSSAKRFLSGTLLSRITGLLRDIVMASAFGTQEAIAAFLVAFRFAHLLRRLLGEGALQTSFIPQFEKLRQDNPARACTFFKDLTALLSLFLAVFITLAMAALFYLSSSNSISPSNLNIIHLTFLMMPSLLFICLYGLNASLLQCERNYFTAGIAPVAFNVVWIISLLGLRNLNSSEAMPWLSLFIVLACAAQWLVTLPLTLKILKKYATPFRWNEIKFFSADLKTLLKPFILGIIGISASQVNNALDTIFARYADLEGPAFLWYAIRLQQLPLALLAIAVSSALLPPLARAHKSGDPASYKQFLEFAIRRSLSLMIPITIGIFVVGDTAVNFVYGRGDFTVESTVGTTQCLWAYGFGLIPMTLVLIFSPAFYALGDYRTPMQASVASVLVNILLNFVLVVKLNAGTPSIALATSLSAWVNLGILSWKLNLTIDSFLSPQFWIKIGKTVLASIMGGLALVLVDQVWHGSQAWQILIGQLPVYSPSFLEQALRLALQASAFAGGFAVVVFLLKADDLKGFITRKI